MPVIIIASYINGVYRGSTIVLLYMYVCYILYLYMVFMLSEINL